MKKRLIIVISAILIISIAIIGIIFLAKRKQTYTFEQITGVNLDNVEYFVDESIWKDDEEKKEIDTEYYRIMLKNAIFEECNEYHNSMMASEVLVAYDKDNNELFSFGVGNHWGFSPDKFDKAYQRIK